MPFVTEELWQHIRKRDPDESIMLARMPVVDDSIIDAAIEEEMSFVQKVIESLRNIRGEMTIPPGKEISVVVRTADQKRAQQIERYSGYLRQLARVSSLSSVLDGTPPPHAASSVVEGVEIFVPLEGLIDLDIERARLGKEVSRVTNLLESTRKKLGSDGFVQRAPEEVIRKEHEKMDRLTKDMEKLRKNLESLK
jgi:valyl-tRNA synthetase